MEKVNIEVVDDAIEQLVKFKVTNYFDKDYKFEVANQLEVRECFLQNDCQSFALPSVPSNSNKVLGFHAIVIEILIHHLLAFIHLPQRMDCLLVVLHLF